MTSYMNFLLAYLDLTLAHSKGRGQVNISCLLGAPDLACQVRISCSLGARDLTGIFA